MLGCFSEFRGYTRLAAFEPAAAVSGGWAGRLKLAVRSHVHAVLQRAVYTCGSLHYLYLRFTEALDCMHRRALLVLHVNLVMN